MLLPTLYLFLIFIFGLNSKIVELGNFLNVPYGGKYGEWFLECSWPITFEYIVFTILFLLTIISIYGREGIRYFATSTFFLFSISLFYMVDTFYGLGEFKVLQIFVPFIVSLSASILGLMGYGAKVFPTQDGVILYVSNEGDKFIAAIYWPCAGIYSLFIYSLSIMILLRGIKIPARRKLFYIIIGASGTLIMNILRIVYISRIGVNDTLQAAIMFHNYFGEIFFIAWILTLFTFIFVIEKHYRQIFS